MKVRYVGRSFGVDGLTNGKIYTVLCVDEITGWLRIIDDSDEDYLYFPKCPRPLTDTEAYGHFEIVEDDEEGSLNQAINGAKRFFRG